MPLTMPLTYSLTRFKTARVAAISVFIIAVVVYLRALGFDFVHDDHSQIVANSTIRSWHSIGQIWVTEVWSQKGEGHAGIYYRPVFMVWLVLTRSLIGLNVLAWHTSSILLHAATALLVFCLALRLFDSVGAATFVGLLFAVHPIHIESVSWISAANELLYSAFVLASLLFFNRFINRDIGKGSTLGFSVLFLGCCIVLEGDRNCPVANLFLVGIYQIRSDHSDSRQDAQGPSG